VVLEAGPFNLSVTNNHQFYYEGNNRADSHRLSSSRSARLFWRNGAWSAVCENPAYDDMNRVERIGRNVSPGVDQAMNGRKDSGIQHLWKAAGYSCSGLKAAWVNETAFRQEVLLAVIILPLGFLLGGNGMERALLISSWLIVLVVELLNSALEAVVDRISLDPHVLAGRAKDLGSAAVFMSLVLALLVWVLVLSDRFLQ
jgi:diacylglycerol kinase (ATP)